ncbi:MAG TPA: GNAT family N-acetyltransferase [Acidimicrobiia bacterium]|nr:GNAT family N-acetyltransferase [Acidimicrobiia bacterium]
MSPRARPAEITDAESIARVHIESWRIAYAEILPADFLAGMSVERRAERWSQLLAQGDSSTVVVETEQGIVAGFATVSSGPEAATGELQAIYLAPEHWGQGLGRTLMGAAEEQLRDAGHEDAVLWVFADNPRARRFYEAAGWELEDVVRIEEIGGVQPQQVRYRRRLI